MNGPDIKKRVTITSAAPDMADPASFIGNAGRDLRRAIRAGWIMFRARIRNQNDQSWLRFAWLLMPVVVIAAVSILLQRRAIVTFGATALPYPAFVVSGLVAWQIFIDAVNAPIRSIEESRRILTHTDAPHEAILIAAALETGFFSLVRMLAAIVLLVVFGGAPGWTILLLPVELAALICFGFAIGIFIAAPALIFSDIRQAISLILFAGAFVTPVFYPISDPFLLALNPVAPFVEGVRASLTGGPLSLSSIYAGAGAFVLLVLAWIFYRLGRPFLVERLS